MARKIISTLAASALLALSLLGAAQPAQAAAPGGELRNKDTGLCVDRREHPERPVAAFTTRCNGSATQRWVYSASDQTIRTPDGRCLATGSTSGIFVTACDSGLLVRWGQTSDGRIHQLDWGIGCIEDFRTVTLTWGACTNSPNEVWSSLATV
ncbi:ricin-type beta-trefoil lectin domain protein [Cellulomonas sp. zg-ZUI222]|uniref:ricin-type beta-trefoil lectin domain protein n=1 Tax=Cellulomonas TaxID=1707 RepID=UPI001A950025|nr:MULTISPECIES: ricin-type beta-trefoil lectin domain protein [Cellulomonas]MBO0898690.1 ricin-type beta-trefoil lectin domain protein [Cellulomonas sp. zg-ZUI22]MBO0919553.1 ricin-type beta-trefoil lectin domain protein [Cellulomonas wangleii]